MAEQKQHPDGFKRWIFGRTTGKVFSRPAASGSKQAITREEIQDLLVYDVPFGLIFNMRLICYGVPSW